MEIEDNDGVFQMHELTDKSLHRDRLPSACHRHDCQMPRYDPFGGETDRYLRSGQQRT